MIRLLAVVLCLWSVAANAALETWPALYDVSGVASDDVLNVRAGPSASFEIIGSLAYNATNVEVVEVDEDRQWGLVNIGEQSGWVSLRFMDRQPRWAGSFPEVTSCFGTEPFWSLTFDENGGKLDRLGYDLLSFPPVQRLSSTNRVDRFAFVSQPVLGTLREEQCSDGMSDRTYGLSIEVITGPAGNLEQLSGCCSIQPDQP